MAKDCAYIDCIGAFYMDADTDNLTATMALLTALRNGGTKLSSRSVAGVNHTNIVDLYTDGLKAEAKMFFDRYK